MNLENNIQLAVTVITAIITLSYLWKTRVIGADKELLNKYKDGYAEYKEKYKEAVKEVSRLNIQIDSMNVRLATLEGSLRVYEGKPYIKKNQSLEADNVADQTIQG